MSIRRYTTALLGGAALALAACGGPAPAPTPPAPGTAAESASEGASPAGELDPLTVGLTYIPDIQFAPFYVAAANGYFAEEGLDVTLRHHGATDDIAVAVDVLGGGMDHQVGAE